MQKRNFDLIVFDWDGTLMDSTSAIVQCIQAAAHDLNLPVPKQHEASHVIGLGLYEAMRAAIPGLNTQDTTRMVERYRHHYLQKDQALTLFEGAQDMLNDLSRAGYVLAIATGKSRMGLARALETVQLASLFSATRCADETHSKPHPAMLNELMHELEHSPVRTVMIGDTTHDLQMATNAGVASIAVQYGAHPAHVLQEHNPQYMARSIPDLHHWLQSHG